MINNYLTCLTGCFLMLPAIVLGQQTKSVAFSQGQSYTVPVGIRKTIRLPDESEVTLNSGTTLWIDKKFSKTRRMCRISGDALFRIHAAVAPFTIYTPHLVLTTKEAVARVNGYASSPGEETLLLSGKLHAIKSYYSQLDHDPYDLTGGEMVMMNKDIDLMEKETFQPADQQAWIADVLAFRATDPNTLMSTLKNWFNVDFRVVGNYPSTLRFTGTFRQASLQDVLRTVGKVWRFDFRENGQTLELRF